MAPLGQLGLDVHLGRRVPDELAREGKLEGVPVGQAPDVKPAADGPFLRREVPPRHDDRVGAERREPRLDLPPGSLPDGDDHGHRSDAEEDPQRREGRPEAMRADLAEGQPERRPEGEPSRRVAHPGS
ncbi:MAG TPA: hypothetical protein PLB02_12100 [Thermoanaerobaculia bacterium]|nr:hypothetical protein [Thermoanaerobaculia bacterium]